MTRSSSRTRLGRSAILLIGLLIAGGSALAEDDSAPASSLAPPTAEPLLSRPIVLLPGQGSLHRRLSTRSREAQKFYDQGLVLLASYSWVDAARSFHQALRADPALAEAMVGLARAQRALGYGDGARRSMIAAGRAAAAPQVTERERRWVEVAAFQQEAIDAPAAQAEHAARDYRRAVESYLRAHPRDPDGFVLRGDAEAGPAGQGQTGGEASLRWYRAALSLASDHPAAHHYLAHSLENLGRPEEALVHAQRFAELAPEAPHAQHLVGHLLPALGRWRDAVEAFERADRLHRQRLAREALPPETDWHFGHNLHLLASACWHLGETTRANALWREAFLLQEHGPRAGALCLPWLELTLLEGREGAALDGARACADRGSAAERSIGLAVEGEVMAIRGDEEPARRLLTEARAALEEALLEANGSPAAAVALEAASRTVRALQGKVALVEIAGDAGGHQLEALARDLAAQKDFDAWSSALLRLHELQRFAERRGRNDLAERIADWIASMPTAGAMRCGG